MGANYWIFQARQDSFDLQDPKEFNQGLKHPWAATRYRADVHPNDLVFFWQAGPPTVRGIYGWGELQSEPYYGSPEDGYVIDVVYRVRFTRRISVEEIEQNLALKNMQILQIAVGTNFRLSRQEANAIVKMIGQRGKLPEI